MMASRSRIIRQPGHGGTCRSLSGWRRNPPDRAVRAIGVEAPDFVAAGVADVNTSRRVQRHVVGRDEAHVGEGGDTAILARARTLPPADARIGVQLIDHQQRSIGRDCQPHHRADAVARAGDFADRAVRRDLPDRAGGEAACVDRAIGRGRDRTPGRRCRRAARRTGARSLPAPAQPTSRARRR